MKNWILPICITLLFSGCEDKLTTKTDLASYVNPFIGTGGHGHTYPGATVPFGMVQLSPDTRLEGWDGCSGYHFTDTVVYGFSHTHLSGTGVSDYGDVLLMPTVGEIQLENGAATGPKNGYASAFYKDAEVAEPGYYFTKLKEGEIDVELTATERAGFHQYTFLKGDAQNVILDLAHRDMLLDWKINQVSATKITGFRISKAWAKEQHIYFSAEFSSPIQRVVLDSLQQKIGLQFGSIAPPQLFVKVGISAVSIANAEENLRSEIPDWDFEKTKQNARAAWNKQLAKIEVQGDEDDKIKFYTSLYHTMLAPNLFSDVNGDYRGMDMQIHNTEKGKEQYTVFSLWDTFRAAHPLFTIIEQDRTNAFVQTFLRQYQQGGLLPVWELAANETNCMIGYHSAPVIADAYVKSIRDFDAKLALEAMVNSANQDHFGLQAYKKQGFIAAGDESESVSKTLEYAYDDWCIATLAEALGDTVLATSFYLRSENWKNLLDPESGFFRARVNNGWFAPFLPAEVNFNYTEANAWQYSLFVPHDIYALDTLQPRGMQTHLDSLFSASSQTSGREQADITGLIGQYAHGNEPSHHMAYLYNFVGRPDKTQKLVHQIKEELYTTQPDGLSGNEDCGQMSAWFVFSALGFYPVTPGTPYYTIGSPTFEESTINLDNGKAFTVKANNWGKGNFYIQNAKLNGRPYVLSYLHHDSIMQGGTLEFTMAAVPNNHWGAPLESRTPLAKSKKLRVPVPYFSTSKNTFKDTLQVRAAILCADCEIYMSILGEPGTWEKRQSWVLKGETDLWAFAKTKDGRYSDTIWTTFYKIDDKLKLTLKSEYANQYAAGGDDALIDRQCGTSDFRTGSWQGYQGQDVEFVLAFGELRTNPKVTIGFLQDVRSWVWFPPEVQFYFSADGKNWSAPITVRHTKPDRDEAPQTLQLSAKATQKAAFVKVVAKNYGVCPPWHLGAGGKSWLFLDEVEVK
jgi:predicted alpha-1,2-mannosidase